MSWVGVGSAVVGAGASIYSSNQAAATAQAGQEQATALTVAQMEQQKQMYNKLLALSSPYRTAGEQGLARYQALTTSPESLYNDPTYQAMLAQGQRAVESSAAARGTQLSGGTLAALQQMGMSTASQYRSQIMNELANLANVGQTSIGQAYGIGGQQMQQIRGAYGNLANLAQQTGQLQAGAALGQGAAITGLAGNVAGAYMKYNTPTQPAAGTGTVPTGNAGGIYVPDLYSGYTNTTPYGISQSYTGAQ